MTISRRFIPLILLFGLAGCGRKLPTDPDSAFKGLIDQNGNPVDTTDHKIHIFLGFAGFGTCPAVCPLMASRLKKIVAEIQRLCPELANKIIKFMVTINPVTDTPDALLARKHLSGITAMTGQVGDIKATLDKINAFYTSPELGDSELMHEEVFRIVDSTGKALCAPIRSSLPVDQIARYIITGLGYAIQEPQAAPSPPGAD